MAKRITAIQSLTPCIELQGRYNTDIVCQSISRGSTLNRGTIGNVLDELHENLVDLLSVGNPVKIDGIGTFTQRSA
jgi:nucleoid DNA-binding protein